MKIDKTKVKKILFISLSNIGDIVLTTPAMKLVSDNFPEAVMDVMVSTNGAELFEKHPAVFRVVEYNKHIPLQDKWRLIRRLREVKYDLIVDMRNSLFPFLLGARYRTSPIRIPSKKIEHKKQQHIRTLYSIGIRPGISNTPFYIHIPGRVNKYINSVMKNIDKKKPIVAISPGAKSEIKRWPKESYANLTKKLIKELAAQVIMVGDSGDTSLIKEISDSAGYNNTINMSGKTTLLELAALLQHCNLLVTNDSAPLHMAGAVCTKALAIFGPTDPKSYGPTGNAGRVVRKNLHCSPCGKAQCEFNHECMNYVKVDEVFEIAKDMIKDKAADPITY